LIQFSRALNSSVFTYIYCMIVFNKLYLDINPLGDKNHIKIINIYKIMQINFDIFGI